MDERRKRRATFGVMLTIFLAAMESTVVATAMPKAVTSLGGLEIYSWVAAGFLLTSTVTMPVWGRMSDLFGRRLAFGTGVVIFLAGSALCGVAQNMTELVAFRMVQGIGAGSLMTIGMTIVGELYPLEQRARMQGYLSGVWGVASLIGPLLGGLLTDHASWRWVFYVNLPFGLLAVVLVFGALPADRPDRRRPVIDASGIVLFTIGVTALLLSLEAMRGGSFAGPLVLSLFGIALVALIVFVWVERRAAEPMMPLRLFRNRSVLAASVVGLLAGIAMFGAVQFVPLFLQAVSGMSATEAGVVLVPFVLGWVAMSVVSARLVLRVGYRSLVVCGMLCLTAAFVLLMQWSETLTLGTAMRDGFIAGVGMGLNMVPLLIAVQSTVTRADMGAATSMTQFFRTIGGAVGVAMMGAVMGRRLAAGASMEAALHEVFVVGFAVSLIAVASSVLVPAGRAQELAEGAGRRESGRARPGRTADAAGARDAR